MGIVKEGHLVAEKPPLFRDIDIFEPRQGYSVEIYHLILERRDGQQRNEGSVAQNQAEAANNADFKMPAMLIVNWDAMLTPKFWGRRAILWAGDAMRKCQDSLEVGWLHVTPLSTQQNPLPSIQGPARGPPCMIKPISSTDAALRILVPRRIATKVQQKPSECKYNDLEALQINMGKHASSTYKKLIRDVPSRERKHSCDVHEFKDQISGRTSCGLASIMAYCWFQIVYIKP